MATKKKKDEVTKPNNMFSELNKRFFDDVAATQSVIILADEITSESCAAVIADILEMNFVPEAERPQVINMLITSPGGDMDAAIAVINTIQGSAIPIRTIAVGKCASAALCILMSGHQRAIAPWTSLLSHQFSTSTEGTFSDLKDAAEEFNSYYAKMVDIYAAFTNLPKDRIEAELLNHRNVFLDPQAAVGYNMADVVCGLK